MSSVRTKVLHFYFSTLYPCVYSHYTHTCVMFPLKYTGNCNYEVHTEPFLYLLTP